MPAHHFPGGSAQAWLPPSVTGHLRRNLATSFNSAQQRLTATAKAVARSVAMPSRLSIRNVVHALGTGTLDIDGIKCCGATR